MNKTIETINNHRSIRDFKDNNIDKSIIDEIVNAAQSMPNSINGQQTSIIVVTGEPLALNKKKYLEGASFTIL